MRRFYAWINVVKQKIMNRLIEKPHVMKFRSAQEKSCGMEWRKERRRRRGQEFRAPDHVFDMFKRHRDREFCMEPKVWAPGNLDTLSKASPRKDNHDNL